MHVELPPVQVVDVEGEVVVPTAAGVGQNVPAALGKAQEDMSGRAQGRWARSEPAHHPTQPTPCPALASPCIEEVLIHDALKGDADPGRQLPEESRGELPTDLGRGRPGILRHHRAEATCSSPSPLTQSRAALNAGPLPAKRNNQRWSKIWKVGSAEGDG